MGVKKTVKRWISLFLVCILALPLQFMPVKAAETDEGLHILETEKELEVGETWKISPVLITEKENKTIVYESMDRTVATVDAKGIVTARSVGETTITLMNRQTEYTGTVKVVVTAKPVRTEMCISNALTDYKLPEKYLSDLYKGPQTGDEHYLGQPDMVMLDDNQTLYTVFPVGHGVGRIIMMVSHDAGETWIQKENIPESWKISYEAPTIYKLNMTDGTRKLILISGRPSDFGAPTGGWDTSISTDGGENWSEFKTWHPTIDGEWNEGVVAMASLVQLKENGEYIDKWMGVYHNGTTFVNYKTYLTFDEEGNEQWSAPEPYLSEYRQIESSYQICEVGMFRSPNGNRIVALAKNQSHNGPAAMFYSDDEGETWTKPAAMPGSLAGERHKILYDPTDPTGQRIIVTFREIIYDLNGNNQFDGDSDWMAGDWIAWVGTYEDIIEGRDGDYRILLCEDQTANEKSGDTGYTGMSVLPDGTFILDTYGHWDKEYSESLPNYNVYDDHCWIKQAKFKLSEVTKDRMEEMFIELPQLSDASNYTDATWQFYKEALEAVETLKGSEGTTVEEINAAYIALSNAYQNLVMKGAGNDEDLVMMAQQALWQAIQRADYKYNITCVSWTADSDKAFREAYDEAKAAMYSTDIAELERLRKKLMDATVDLEVGWWGPPEYEFEVNGNIYRATIVKKYEGLAMLMKGTDVKKVTIDTVSYYGKTYKVVAIASNAFSGCKTLQNVTIGANVIRIGENAFDNCRKIKKVIFKGKKLPEMKNAFQKTNKKLTVKVQKDLNKKASVKKKTMKTLKRAGLKVSLKNIK